MSVVCEVVLQYEKKNSFNFTAWTNGNTSLASSFKVIVEKVKNFESIASTLRETFSTCYLHVSNVRYSDQDHYFNIFTNQQFTRTFNYSVPSLEVYFSQEGMKGEGHKCGFEWRAEQRLCKKSMKNIMVNNNKMEVIPVTQIQTPKFRWSNDPFESMQLN